MFQIIEQKAQPEAAAERVKALRQILQKAKVDAYVVPRADEHQGEYVAASAERLKWLTGFSGSAGFAAITAKTAAVFVDGRYTVQVKFETDRDLFSYPGIARLNLANWLIDNLKPGSVIGFDPWLITIAEHQRLTTALAQADLKLKPGTRNLIDKIWGKARPKPSSTPVTLHPLKYAGEPAAKKISRVQDILRESSTDYAILTQPDSIAWLLNIRGNDIPHTPVALAFALVPRSGKPELFIDPQKVSDKVAAKLAETVKLKAPDALRARLQDLKANGKVASLDPETAAFWFQRVLGSKAHYKIGTDPCLNLKAIKNSAEIAGSKSAHIRDGHAIVRFLAWLDSQLQQKTLEISELDIVEKLEAFRRDTGALKEISFDTISGSGPNGAIVHYRVSTATNRTLRRGELLLVDSGAQFLDGTTDITRTVALGRPTNDMRLHYTLVLKGHVAIAMAKFPIGTRGLDLDPLARKALWQYGLDYDHGTGHGIGSYLSVHEGPQSISKAGRVVLEPGMILSNEPGYYKEDSYGIRIENLVLINPPATPQHGERDMLSFTTLTMAPYDQALIDVALLDTDERDWIDAYHAEVYRTLTPDLDTNTRDWLKKATRPLEHVHIR